MRKNYSKKYVLLCAFLMMSVMAFAQTGSIKGKYLTKPMRPCPALPLLLMVQQLVLLPMPTVTIL
jgi:hypothetical protein